MKGLAFLAFGALLVSGCGSVDQSGEAPTGSARVADGTYEVGKDLEPGVYTAAPGCLGTISSKAGYRVDDVDGDAFLGGSVTVGDQQRVALETGQFFISQQCAGGWEREDGSKPATPDPKTRAGACAILTGSGLVDEALSIARDPARFESPRAAEVQNELFSIVVSQTPKLWRSAGELVDLLDDPAGYGEPGAFTTRIDAAVGKIRTTCG